MVVLAFVLECAAVGALVTGASSLVVFALSLLLREMAKALSSSRKADLALLLSTAPALTTLGVVVAISLPPIVNALGSRADDCSSHSHHGHFCLVHSGAPGPALMVLGAAALALFAIRALLAAGRLGRSASNVALLETLGQVEQSRFPIVWLPGAPRLCLATGILRRRILISTSLGEELGRLQLEAALAHEQAHLRRQDPLASLSVQLGGLFALPFIAGHLACEHAAFTEEACDQEAARAVGEPVIVAEALVKVASLASQRGPALAFGVGVLEARVHALLRLSLADPIPVRRPMLIAATVGLLSTLSVVLGASGVVHHAVETLLQGFL